MLPPQLSAATFFGRGWRDGVGMCQVGAFGIALEAGYEAILKKYYAGIELRKVLLST
jgi:stage II sporulation protein D